MSDVARRSSSVDDAGGAAAPGFENAYALPDLEAVASAFRRTRHGRWLSIARGLSEALGVPAVVEDSCRPEVDPAALPPATVFLLAAIDRDPPGCLGHVSARPASWTLGGPGLGQSPTTIAGGADLVEVVVDRVVESVRTISPEAIRPEIRVVVPFDGEGDSHALGVAIAAMHALLRAPVVRGLAATGGFDIASGRFSPVPPETLAAKLAAAARWGIRTLVIVEGQVLPDAVPDGIDLIRIATDPGALPLLVLELAGIDTDDEGDGRRRTGFDPRSAWQHALALYDLRVATRLDEPVEAVLRKTGPFVESMAAGLDSDRPPTPTEVRAVFDGLSADSIVVGLAADIRSRALLHAGRSVEAAWWDAVSVGLRGLGDLPEGMLGDHLLYRQPAHRSVLAIDLGELDDPDDSGDRSGVHPHAVLDAAILDLEHRWCSRHQALFALFASNTRWRRRLYLARRDLDLLRFDQAESDLLRWRARWEDLLEAHARRGLGMGNTDLARQWNAVLEHATTEVSLRDPEGFASNSADPELREGVARRWRQDGGLRRDLDARMSGIDALSAFDLRGLLQWFWLDGSEPVPDSVASRCRGILGTPEGQPVSAVRGVAEWWWRLADGREADRALACATLRRSIEPELHSADGISTPPVAGIHRLVALRRARLLDLEGVSGAPARTWVDSIIRPDRPESLRRSFDDLAAKPALLPVRTPY